MGHPDAHWSNPCFHLNALPRPPLVSLPATIVFPVRPPAGQTPFASPMAPTTNHPEATTTNNNGGVSATAPGRSPPPVPENPHIAPDTTAVTSTASSNAATAAEIEAVHRGDVHAQLYGRIAGWGGSCDSLFGQGTRGENVPDPARDVVMGMLRPRPEDRLESGEVLRLPWVASRGQGTGVGVAAGGGLL